MAIPRVFISSTCYDLKHIRESLKYFVKTIGYEPVLSDEGDVFYSPDIHTHESCLKEVETCQIFILIIGGRYGGKFIHNETSITNNEYKTAIENNTPIFALVEQSVYSEHLVFSTNKKQHADIAHRIAYPSVDNVKIFEFIDEVRKQIKNNAIYSFKDFSDIESYLKKQWAGMMYDFITNRNSNDRAMLTNRLLDDLSLATKKTEELLKLIARQSAGETSEQVEEKIEQIEQIATLSKAIKHIGDALLSISKAFSNLTPNEFINYLSDSDNIVDFINHIAGITVVGFTLEPPQIDLLQTIGEARFRAHTFTEEIVPQLVKSFEQLKASDHDDLIKAFQDLYKQ